MKIILKRVLTKLKMGVEFNYKIKLRKRERGDTRREDKENGKRREK